MLSNEHDDATRRGGVVSMAAEDAEVNLMLTVAKLRRDLATLTCSGRVEQHLVFVPFKWFLCNMSEHVGVSSPFVVMMVLASC